MAKVCDIKKMSDLEIRDAILQRDNFVTKEFFYKKCYYKPFKSFFDNYVTNCESCKEFIDEIYLQVITPSEKTKRCKLEDFRGDSTLKTWLHTVCLYYCYRQFGLAKRDPLHNSVSSVSNVKDDENEGGGGKDIGDFVTNEIDLSGLNRADVETLLSLMPNKRYSKLIRLLHLEQKTPTETAEILGMTMSNYYNKRILAEKQFNDVRRKEERNG